jgi:hypothetical protein
MHLLINPLFNACSPIWIDACLTHQNFLSQRLNKLDLTAVAGTAFSVVTVAGISVTAASCRQRSPKNLPAKPIHTHFSDILRI